MSCNPNGGDELKLSTFIGKMDWELVPHELFNCPKRGGVVFEIWIHSQNQFFDCGGDLHKRSLQRSARWNSPVPADVFLSSATFTMLKSVLILWYAILSYNRSWTLNLNHNTIRYNTKYRMGIKACSRSTAIRGHKFPTKRRITWNLRT